MRRNQVKLSIISRRVCRQFFVVRRSAHNNTKFLTDPADKEAHGKFESECPGCCGAQDTFHVGTLKEGRFYNLYRTQPKILSAYQLKS